MKCPYCKANLSEGSQFCSKCGQNITDSAENTININKYWDDVDTLNDINENERISNLQKAKSEAHSRTTSIIRKVLIFVVLAVAFVITLFFLNSSNQKKLEFIKSDAIGKTYSDISGGSVMSSGDKRDRIIVSIKDENTLSYTKGNYTLHISENEDGYSTSWSQNEIYDTGNYEYNFSISLLGKVTLKMNGNTYDVRINDDGTIYNINFYDD